MKRLIFFLVFTLAGSVSAQTPDPRDSIILESKTILPQARPGESPPYPEVMRIRVDFTNKDSLVAWQLGLVESTLTGNAFATLGRALFGRNFGSVFTRLTETLPAAAPLNVQGYHSNSPDTFASGSFFINEEDNTKEPPNFVRKPFLEIKFDSVTGPGKFVLDTIRVGATRTAFNKSPLGARVDVNFVKAVITVVTKGDLNKNLYLDANDIMKILDCVFLNIPPVDGLPACDLDCDGEATAADVIALLLAAYLGIPFPC